MNEKQLQALIRKNAAKASKAPSGGRGPYQDPTLAATRSPDRETDDEAKQIFKEMKRREF